MQGLGLVGNKGIYSVEFTLYGLGSRVSRE